MNDNELDERFRLIEEQLATLWEDHDEDQDDHDDHDQHTLATCKEIQQQEVDLLQAVFFAPGELSLEGGGDHSIPLSLAITLTPDSEEEHAFTTELHATLPRRYPLECGPQLVVRAPRLDKTEHGDLQSSLRRFVAEQPRGEPVLLAAVEHLRDSIRTIAKNDKTTIAESDGKQFSERRPYCRLWILSHHIYSRSKRKLMLALAGDLRLNGFLLPGKPGIVCIEGEVADCEEWWMQIRSLHWKKIAEKKRDAWEGPDGVKFPPFAELASGDFATFRSFLETRGLFETFVEMFGFNTQTSE